MLLTDFVSIPSSFKKIIFNDRDDGEDHDFRKITPTNATLKITVNEKLNGFKQCNELNRKMKSLQCKIRRRRKKQKKAKISVKGWEGLS